MISRCAFVLVALLAPSAVGAQSIDSLTLEEKVGQMLVPRLSGAYQHGDASELGEIETLAREGRIGGVVLFAGSPYASRRLVERLEAVSAIAPLIASDYEWGVAMRVAGAAQLPRAMALGAAGSEELVREHARVTALEARALGVEMVLAPVLDVVAVPGVIGTRSFGSDPERVAALGAAWIEEVQGQGLFAVAKHYPGHGATRDDSHLMLPLVEDPLEVFAARDLVPFERAVEAGVAGIMPGHLAVPALDGRVDRPASRSPEILARLRQGGGAGGLRFEGLIVSDALDMAGARADRWDGGVAVDAVRAGVDLLLLPPDPRVAHVAIVDAVRSGRLPEQRIDEAVARILELKRALVELRATRPPWQELDDAIGGPEAVALADRIASRALTLLDDPAAIVPFASSAPPRLLLASVVRDRDGVTDTDLLRDELRRRASPVRSVVWAESALASADLAALDELARDADAVVVAHYANHRHPANQALDRWLRGLEEAGTPTVLIPFLNPWVAPVVGPGISGRRARLIAWDPSASSQRAVAAALFGEQPITGRLPLPLGPFPLGGGSPRPRSVAVLDDERLRRGWIDPAIDWRPALEILSSGIDEGGFPGAVTVVLHGGEVALAAALGRQTYHAASPEIALDTLWDLASLTKVVVTTTLSMMAVDEGRLDLEAPVASYLPEFSGGGKEAVTIVDLLTHSSGVLWWTDLHLRHGHLPREQAWRAYLDEIDELPLESPPGAEMVYSDLGVMLLGRILERVFGRDLDELARLRILEPLGMADTMFAPPAELLPRIAPTEIDEAWRGRLVHGEVHDENAAGLGGVAPHAGLFSTGRDLAVFTQMLLDGGFGAFGGDAGEGVRLLNGATVRRFTRRVERVPGSSRALGWDTPSQPSSAGALFSPRSFGHTGFTGTSIWIDPERELISILLTNRVHPSRERRGIYALRGRYHDAVASAIDGAP
ncbi:MAG TPA: serine hydrolase [Thermoanaerobaculia bacterium]|nr:serine hydrolase [Thermoanaerobaculia bacterium]